MGNEKILCALGLCARARGLICGTPMVCEALRAKQKPRLVVEASENAPNTSKRIADKCAFYGVERMQLEVNGEALARAVGKSGRVAVVAISDENLCRLVRNAKTEKHS